MIAAAAQPVPAAPAASPSEMQIMQAIVGNCAALGIEPEAARRMAVRAVLNLRRAGGTA